MISCLVDLFLLVFNTGEFLNKVVNVHECFFLNHFLHINTSFILTLFFVNTVGLFYCFYKAWKVDPGLIHRTETEQYKVSHWEVVLVREITFHHC